MIDGAFGNLGKFKLNRLRKFSLRQENIRAISSQCCNAYLGDFQSICKVLGRFNVYIDSKDRTLGIQLLMNGFWEIEVTECVAQQVKPGMNVIDVGSNYGYFTLLMAGLIGNQKGKVYSVEANPYIYPLLKNTIKTNGLKSRVALFNLAITDKEEDRVMFNYSEGRGMNGHLAIQKEIRDDEHSISVLGNKLDNIIEPGERVDFIKVDIEGAEKMFWDGSTRIRKENPQLKILMEFNAKRYIDVDLFLDAIFEEGFGITQIKSKPSDNCLLSKAQLLAIPTDSHVMLLLERNSSD